MTPAAAPPGVAPVYGLDYGPYTEGDAPPATVPEALVRHHLSLLRGRTSWIKVVGVSHGQRDIPRLAHQMGFQVAAAAWISGNPGEDAREMAQLEEDVRRGCVQLAIVGSEAIHDHAVTTAQLVADLDRVRRDLNGRVPVATVEPDRETLANPELMAHEDVVMVNIPPISYQDVIGTDPGPAAVQRGLAYVASVYAQLQRAAGTRPVAIGETEWASAGFPVTTPANAAAYFVGVERWARAHHVPCFYFEVFDEPWLGQFNAVGAHWGVFTADGTLKPGMAAGFSE